ncbi:MAG: hypothetical protein NTY09_03245 [bacterium]|nr:hypothetical protein [bacterium]
MYPFTGKLRKLILAGISLALFILLGTSVNAAPNIISIDPNFGTQGDIGLQIDIFGSGFELGPGNIPPVVQFGSGADGITIIPPVIFIDQFNLTVFIDINIATIPQFYTVWVINQSDLQQDSLLDAFNVLPKPLIFYVNPDQGYTGDTAFQVIITGQYLETTFGATFGAGVTVDSIDYVTPSEVQCTISIDWTATPGFRDVTLLGEIPIATLPDGFEVLGYPAPVINSVDPPDPCYGDDVQSLTVYGTGFLQGIGFNFDPIGIIIANTNYISPTEVQLDVFLGGAAIGTYSLTGTNPDEQIDILDPAFVIKDCTPIIENVVPDTGFPGDTGLAVSIFGAYFSDTTGVDFSADITVTDFNIISDTQIDATLDIDPLATLGFRDVEVTSNYGTGTLPNGFEVVEKPLPPEILEINPAFGNQGDTNLPVSITGNYLENVTTVDFGPGIIVTFIDAAANVVNVTLDIDLAAAPGFRDVTVSGSNGNDTLVDGFEVIETIFPPEIIGVNPGTGYQGDTTLPVSITGNYLADVTSVDFGPGIIVTFIDATANTVNVTLDIDIAATPGFRDVTVSGSTGDDTLVNGFEVIETIIPPEITGVNPNTGYQGDVALPVAISGNNFADITSVDFGAGITVTFVAVSMNLVNVELDIDVAATPGFRDVTVFGNNGDDILTDGFEVLSSSPIIDSVVPNLGQRGTVDLNATITGQNLLGVDTVDFGSDITVTLGTVTDTSVDVLLTIDLAATPGVRDVTVTNNLLLSDTLPGGFTVTDIPISQPNISDIDPNFGYPGDQNLDVAITGTDFMDGITVDFGTSDIVVSNVQFNDSTSITATINIGAGSTPGQYNVTVENPDGGSDVLVNGFEIIALPTIEYIDPNQGYPGDYLPFQLHGGGFQSGATFYVDPPDPFIDITYQVDSATLISGTIEIDPLASPGLIDLFVENPDGKIATAPDAFEILPLQPEEPFIESIAPSNAYQGDTINFQVIGGNFQTGAMLEFPGLEGFIDLTYDVDSSEIINGSMEISSDAPPGVYDVKVTNPDELSATLQSGFTILEKVIEVLSIDSVTPDQLCRDVTTEVVIRGNAFEIESYFSFEYNGAPFNFISVQNISFISPNEYRLLLDVDPAAPIGLIDIKVENPDEAFAYGPQIEIIECGYARMLWQETLLDIVINQDGIAGGTVEGNGSATIQNVGDVAFDDVIIGMTDLVSYDGRKITPENVEIFPSVVGELGPGFRELIEVRFTIPVSEDLITNGGGVFMGSMVARDRVTGDYAALPVSVTILSAGRQVIEIDPLCLQVDLYNPGVPASQVPDLFNWSAEDGDFPSEIVDNIGGCVDPFPVFEWSVYADGCPGYNVTWIPTYTLTIYPLYPSQSPESAMSNAPVWRVEGIDQDYIQYSYPGEQLSGLYLWQLEVVPEPLPGLAVDVIPGNPVLSDIWVFCVETGKFQEPPSPEVLGEILWEPDQQTINGAGMVREDLVLSDSMVSNLGADPISISILDEAGNKLVTWEGNLSVLQLSYDSPIPDYGPVTIPFGVNLTPIGDVGPDMDPSDFALQFYNGGNLICETNFRSGMSGRLQGYAYIGGSEDSFEIDITWPWENPCWDVWVQWWDANAELDQDCAGEWDALESAESALEAAKADYDAAEEAANIAGGNYLYKFIESLSTQNELNSAIQSCENFFSVHVLSDLVNFSLPGPGWSYFEAFGGQIGVWYNGDAGAEIINNLMDENRDEYTGLWDRLRWVQEANDNAEAGLQDSASIVNDAKAARDEASSAFNAANEAYNEALANLNSCLERMNSLRENIAALETDNADCFWWFEGGNATGVGIPGFNGGPLGPPMGGDSTNPDGTLPNGEQPGSTTGFGTSEGPCPCEICDHELAAMLDSDIFHSTAQTNVDDLNNQLNAAMSTLDEAHTALNSAQGAYDLAKETADEAQKELDDYLQTNVYSDTVGGTPDYGPGHVRIYGIDIYFSDFETFQPMYDLNIDGIFQLWDRLDNAQIEWDTANEALLRAMLNNMDASNKVADLKNEMGGAQNDLVHTKQVYLDALMTWIECGEDSKLCQELYGCPPYDVPGETGGDQQSGAGIPAGQGTGTGEGAGESPCPCEDCSVYYDALVEALVSLSDAGDTLTAAENTLNEAKAVVDELGTELDDAQIAFDSAQDSYNQALKEVSESSGPSVWDIILESSKALMDEAEVRLAMAQEAYDNGIVQAEIALENFTTAQNQYDEAVAQAVAAQYAYEGCLRRLDDCREQNGCGPDEGTSPDPFGLPGSPLPEVPGSTSPQNPGDDSGGTTPPPK